MKVFALVVLAIASVSGKGSGPYLPSGWRPDGPAFVLPTEVKPSENPLKDEILAGSEASGSDFLREYGPPKVQEISLNLINQGLPDAITEQTFNAISPLAEEVKESVAEVETVVEDSEAKTEEASIVQNETATEPILEEKTTILSVVEVETTESQTSVADDVATTNTDIEAAQVTSEDSVQNVEITESVETEGTSQQTQESTLPNVEIIEVEQIVSEQVSQESNQQEESVTSISESADTTEKSGQTETLISLQYTNDVSNLQQAQNIPEIIASLENEIKNQQVDVNQAVSDVTSVQVSGALEQVPEGFLEYGPPGFAEYGPPKAELTDDEDKSANLLSFETNETRRRRFSPKFRSSKKH